jgi:uracil-DNA glycosylase
LLLKEVRECTICKGLIPEPIKPFLQASSQAKILIAGQAPGKKVHETDIIFNDPSGVRLREWMGVSKDIFYDKTKIAILPMGFCYPGSSSHGDLPPRPECAPAWRQQLLQLLPNIELTLVIGKYAQEYHLREKSISLTTLVLNWKSYWPNVIPLPHPSPRNNIWLKKNPWFDEDVLPVLRQRVLELV